MVLVIPMFTRVINQGLKEAIVLLVLDLEFIYFSKKRDQWSLSN